ncbi:MAG: 2-oxoacid:acceptor oxidoreductase subunit alpha, partial [candidate division WOR-3 bacterium]
MKAKILTGTHYMLGDHACAEGAIAAGCRFFAGYPITPSTEIAEWISRRLPLFGGIYIQMEDEIASITALIGASCGGVKSMTATSGPGYSLMVEGIGLAVMLEVPCVIVNVQRGAPSTGLPTLVGQGDVMQARWGSHGDYEIIALAPNSCQEMFDLTIKAFNLSEKYRVPVTILSDEAVGHLREKVVIPPEEKIEIIDRKKPNVSPEEYWPYIPDEDLVPPMAIAGEGYFVHMTGLTHDERGYPDITGEAHERLVRRLIDKIQKNRKDIIEYEEVMLDDAEIVVVSFGIT